MASNGAGQLLLDLPSRGYFSSTVPSTAAPARLQVYICDHDTSPPEEQIIKTDATNILIRSLSRNAKADSKMKDKAKAATDSGRGKRPAERTTDEKNGLKRANTGTGASSSRNEGLGTADALTEKKLQGYTVEKLRALLKKQNLPRTGKKEELIARLKQAEKSRS